MTQSPHADTGHHHSLYIRHIDGLRAVAVVPVVAYHALSMLCPGGYVGVDVFFVISGFLITKGIVGDLQAERFSIREFYVRRIKRIIPAYFLTILFVLGAFPFLVSYPSYRDICQAGLSSVFYSANIFFYSNTDYFVITADKNPLLHLWSLGVEEQFYLIIPLGLMLLWKCGWQIFRVSVIMLFVTSLIASVIAVSAGSTSFAFYLLPCRAWELLAGSLIAIFPIRRAVPKILGSALALGGLTLIGTACFGFSETTPFPGAAALFPVIGAILVILFGVHGPAGTLLESPPAVFVGKISYSLYLWHWPLTLIITAINPPGRVPCILSASMVAAYLSYKLVETPFRKAENIEGTQAFTLLAAGSSAVIACCWLMPAGSAALFPEIATRNAEGIKECDGQPLWSQAEKLGQFDSTSCKSTELEEKNSRVALRIGSPLQAPDFVLWGDSHALALLPGVDKIAANLGRAGIYINLKHSLTCWGEKSDGTTYDPRTDVKLIVEWLEGRPDLPDVILANRWLVRLRDDSDVREVVNLCGRLTAKGKRVFILTTVPEADLSEMRRYSWGLPVAVSGATSEHDYEKMAVFQNRMAETLRSANTANVIALHKAFIREGSYQMFIDEKCVYQDSNHLTQHGAIIGMKAIAPLIWPDKDP